MKFYKYPNLLYHSELNYRNGNICYMRKSWSDKKLIAEPKLFNCINKITSLKNSFKIGLIVEIAVHTATKPIWNFLLRKMLLTVLIIIIKILEINSRFGTVDL